MSVNPLKSTFLFTLLFISGFFTLLPVGNLSAGDRDTKKKMLKMYRQYQEEAFPNAPEISVDSLLKLISRDSVVLVDVREPKERAVSRIPHAIDREAFERDVRAYRNRKIIVYCTIGYRSGLYTQQLQAMHLDAYNLIGGVLSWAHAGKKFSSPDGDSLRVHVYGKKWNLLPDGYLGIW